MSVGSILLLIFFGFVFTSDAIFFTHLFYLSQHYSYFFYPQASNFYHHFLLELFIRFNSSGLQVLYFADYLYFGWGEEAYLFSEGVIFIRAIFFFLQVIS